MSGEQELLNTYRKLEQDIKELTEKRSNLQNEIETKEKASRDKLTVEYTEHQNKIQEGIVEVEKLTQRTKDVADKASAELNKRSADCKAEWEKLGVEASALDKEKVEFEEYKKTETLKLNNNFVYLAQEEAKNKERAKELEGIAKGQEERKYSLENLKFQADYSIDESNKVLTRITAEKQVIKEEEIKIEANLVAIEDEKNLTIVKLKELAEKEEELKKLASVKVDVIKLENLKVEVEEKVKRAEELSKDNAIKKTELEEKETTLNEKQRLLILDMRKNDDKIKTIQELREAMKKDA